MYGTMQNCSFYLAEGYQIFRGLLPHATVLGVRDYLQGAMERTLRDFAHFGLDPTDLIASSRVAQHVVATQPELDVATRITLMGHFPLRDRLARELWAIPREPALRAVLSEALKSERLFMHMPPTARFILPGNAAAGVPPHQDISYNRHMPSFVVLWVPLVDIDMQCGGMAVYQGTKDLPAQQATVNRDGWLSPIDVSGYKRIECQPMSLGDCILFGPHLAHGSMPNMSQRVRLSIDFRFFADGTSGKHALDMQTWQVLDPVPPAING
ncbi:MAG: phytanoyl-CoA dioxygenase family protein [Alphaproteobacteria bacterium]